MKMQTSFTHRNNMQSFDPKLSTSDEEEIGILQRLVAELKQTPIVTLAGKGGAYEYINDKIRKLEEEQ